MRSPLVFSLVLALISSARADLAEMDARFAKLPPGTSVIDTRGIAAFALQGSVGKAALVPVKDQPFAEAQQIRTTIKPANAYSLQLGVKTIAPVKKGDVLLGVVFARGAELPKEGTEAHSEMVFELGREPYTKSVSYPLAVGLRWEKFYVPFVSAADYPTGEGAVLFRAGYDPQVIEIGGVRIINYGHGLAISDLPYTPTTYRGREADAPWRKAAAERIEKFRKGNLVVTVVGADKRPVADAEVTVRMKRHAYGFGSAIDAQQLLADGPDADKFRDVITRDFNKVVIENHLKWNTWEHDRETGPRAVAWLRDRGIDVRGHVLVWPGKHNLPKAIHALFDRPDELRRTILEHIADEATALRGQFVEWDVLNEPFSNTDVQKVLGESCLAEWFRAARAADPKAKLDINDYSILETGGRDTVHQDHYFQTIKRIRDAGAPLEGIGIQGHFSEDLTPIPRLTEILDHFATFGLPIQITEFNVNTYDEQLQADYTRDFMTLVFSHPSTIGILTWGFWEKRHWIPAAAFYRADWSLRPAGRLWSDLVFKEWWTPDSNGRASARGEFQMRGFSGDYQIAVKAGGREQKQVVRLAGPETKAEIQLP